MKWSYHTLISYHYVSPTAEEHTSHKWTHIPSLQINTLCLCVYVYAVASWQQLCNRENKPPPRLSPLPLLLCALQLFLCSRLTAVCCLVLCLPPTSMSSIDNTDSLAGTLFQECHLQQDILLLLEQNHRSAKQCMYSRMVLSSLLSMCVRNYAARYTMVHQVMLF